MPKTLRLPLAAVVAVLALPAAASASDIGSTLDPSRGTADTIECPGGCSFAMDTIGTQVYADEDGTVTSFRAKLAPGSTATLRAFSRGGYGAMTPTASGTTVTGTGQLETYAASMPIHRNETIGLDLDGTIDATRDTGTIRVLDGYPAPAGVESQTAGYDLEPTLNATITPDAPPADDPGDSGSGSGSGSGWGTSGGSGGGSAGTGSGTTQDTTTSGGTGGGGNGSTASGKGGPRSAENVRSRMAFTIQDTGVLVARGRHPHLTAFVYNAHTDSMSGKATLSVGGKVVSRAKVWVSSQDDVTFKLSRKVARKLAKGKPATVKATVSNDDDGTESDAFAPKLLKPKTTRFDGRYKAKGPVSFEVRDGIVQGMTTNLLAMSTQGSGSMLRSFYLPDGVPAIVGKNGKVEVHGHWSSDEMRFKGEFKRNGTVKGYTSLWHYEIGLSSGGSIQSKPFLGASNWVAKRVGR